MRNLFMLLALMLAIVPARCQIITGCEYFFDTDPGTGNGTAVTVAGGDSVILTTSVPTNGLSDGFHILYFRVENADGTWSLYEGRTFYIQPIVSGNTALLTNAEYFYDTDPGIGNGTQFTVTQGDSLTISTTVSTAALSNGFHRLYVRAENADGKWSLYEGRTIYIQNIVNQNTAQLNASEYFFDTDPGIGNGTAFTVTAGDSLQINTTVPTAGLSNGFHHMYVRALNTDGKWSLYEGRTFYIQEPPDNQSLIQITYAEYFIDTDMGQGNGISLAITPVDSIDGSFSIPESLSLGVHTIVIRCKNSLEKWSLNEPRQFDVGWPGVQEINPNQATLFQNYPNPFSSFTSIEFKLVKPDNVVLTITDILGKTVKEFYMKDLAPGKHLLFIDKNDLDDGMYFYQMATSDFTDTRQMIHVK